MCVVVTELSKLKWNHFILLILALFFLLKTLKRKKERTVQSHVLTRGTIRSGDTELKVEL